MQRDLISEMTRMLVEARKQNHFSEADSVFRLPEKAYHNFLASDYMMFVSDKRKIHFYGVEVVLDLFLAKDVMLLSSKEDYQNAIKRYERIRREGLSVDDLGVDDFIANQEDIYKLNDVVSKAKMAFEETKKALDLLRNKLNEKSRKELISSWSRPRPPRSQRALH